MIVDLFSGPGGWDVGAAELGLAPVGFEWEPNACATRAAAGHATIRADLANYGMPDSADIEGIIGSPPCPLFSTAGKREGVQWLPHLCEVAAGINELSPDAPVEAALSLKPLEWVLRHRPRWFALEQVPDVVVLWGAVAGRLRGEGYSTWTGVLNSANYGVPQTRRRAILIASLDRVALPPEPTHARDPEPSLFGELAPWVSMADALGIDGINAGLDWKPGGTREDAQVIPGDQPAPALTAKSGGQWHLGFPRNDDRGDSEDGYRDRDWFPADGPAQSITEKARSMEWQLRGGSATGQYATTRDLDQPAPTLAFVNAASDWVFQRPATTIAGDPRVAPPGHRDRANGERQYGEGTIRLTTTQAATLQTFPPNYPWQGSKTAQFQQIGNAVPPLLARRVLEQVAS